MAAPLSFAQLVALHTGGNNLATHLPQLTPATLPLPLGAIHVGQHLQPQPAYAQMLAQQIQHEQEQNPQQTHPIYGMVARQYIEAYGEDRMLRVSAIALALLSSEEHMMAANCTSLGEVQLKEIVRQIAVSKAAAAAAPVPAPAPAAAVQAAQSIPPTPNNSAAVAEGPALPPPSPSLATRHRPSTPAEHESRSSSESERYFSSSRRHSPSPPPPPSHRYRDQEDQRYHDREHHHDRHHHNYHDDHRHHSHHYREDEERYFRENEREVFADELQLAKAQRDEKHALKHKPCGNCRRYGHHFEECFAPGGPLYKQSYRPKNLSDPKQHVSEKPTEKPYSSKRVKTDADEAERLRLAKLRDAAVRSSPTVSTNTSPSSGNTPQTVNIDLAKSTEDAPPSTSNAAERFLGSIIGVAQTPDRSAQQVKNRP